MGVQSKHSFRLVDPNLPCSTLHPGADSCIINYIIFLPKFVKGSANLFFIIYLFQLVLKLRGLRRKALGQQVVCYLKDCLAAAFVASTAAGSLCLFRWMLGRYTVPTLGLVPGFLGGAGIFIEDPSRRDIAVTLFLAMVSDLYLKLFQYEGVLTLGPTAEFLIFSLSSTALLFCLRNFRNSHSVLWPFVFNHPPAKPTDKRNKCSHEGDCLNSIKKIGKTYFLYGLAVQTLKLTILHFRQTLYKPTTSFVTSFFKPANLRLPLFAGLYVTLYKGMCCLLRSVEGQEEEWHTLPAAAVASLCYLIQPNFSLALLAFSNLSQILCRRFRSQLGLPAWPWRELLFMVCMGLLFHARAAFPHCFPPYMLYVMDTVTDGRAPVVYDLVEKHIMQRF